MFLENETSKTTLNNTMYLYIILFIVSVYIFKDKFSENRHVQNIVRTFTDKTAKRMICIQECNTPSCRRIEWPATYKDLVNEISDIYKNYNRPITKFYFVDAGVNYVEVNNESSFRTLVPRIQELYDKKIIVYYVELYISVTQIMQEKVYPPIHAVNNLSKI